MKNIFLKLYIIAFYFCSTALLFADPGTEDSTGTGNLESGDAAAPIDDYVWIMALVGLIFVFMKFRAMKKNRIQG